MKSSPEKLILVVLALFISLVVSGCASIEGINKNYARINLKDGVGENEAKIMAQKVLLDSGKINQY